MPPNRRLEFPLDVMRPSGNHAFVSTSQNRNMTSGGPLTLLADGVQSLDISFVCMMYGLDGVDAVGSVELSYSALGDFTDKLQITTFGIGQAGLPVVRFQSPPRPPFFVLTGLALIARRRK